MNTATQTAKHTTGPHEACEFGDGWVINGADGLRTAMTYSRDNEGEEGANAKLYAAAPELLEACKEVVESLHNLGLQDCYGRSFGGTHTRGVDCPCTCCKVRAAIAKAEGR